MDSAWRRPRLGFFRAWVIATAVVILAKGGVELALEDASSDGIR